MATKKRTPAAPPRGTEIVSTLKASLPELEQEFAAFQESVDAQLAIEDGSKLPAQTDPERQQIEKYLGEAALPERRDRVGWFIGRCQAEAALLKQRADMVRKRAKFYEMIAERIEGTILMFMQVRSVLRIEGDVHRFSRRKNPPSVRIVDEVLIPAEFYEMQPVLQKQKILDALKRGEEVPGCELATDREHLVVE